jgi:hypothetical protein
MAMAMAMIGWVSVGLRAVRFTSRIIRSEHFMGISMLILVGLLDGIHRLEWLMLMVEAVSRPEHGLQWHGSVWCWCLMLLI